MCDRRSCNGVFDPEEGRVAVVDTNDTFPDSCLVDFDRISTVVLIRANRLHVVQRGELATDYSRVVMIRSDYSY